LTILELLCWMIEDVDSSTNRTRLPKLVALASVASQLTPTKRRSLRTAATRPGTDAALNVNGYHAKPQLSRARHRLSLHSTSQRWIHAHTTDHRWRQPMRPTANNPGPRHSEPPQRTKSPRTATQPLENDDPQAGGD